jgi:bifunctional UDP-N-acetylglucosamine pyrophosphorylase / glucosamine-1-phosphate N-acetyltransferase
MAQLRTIILAAGKGTRMKSQTPKVLHAVGGRPLIQYVLDIARQVGSLKIFVALGHQMPKVSAVLGDDVTAYEQKKLLGTADAIRQASRFFSGYSGDVLILCGDTPLLRLATVRQILRRHRSAKADCTFLTAVVANSNGYGRIIRRADASPIAIREEKDASLEEKDIKEINVGVYCFKSAVLFEGLKKIKLNPKKKEFYLTDIIDILSRESRKIITVSTEDACEGLGVNSREELATAANILRQRTLTRLMENGVTIEDPASTFINPDAVIGQDTIIRPFTYIESGVRIGHNCQIGPFARLRPGTRIGNYTEIGNFAEVSRTQMGERCFMKHFSFLGDARIGNEVNIGAGVVTANYDGVNKNTTVVADNAFIGSDSILVAPVTIGRKAVTGAGCVVVKGKNIPAGAIAVGVPARVILKK